MKRHITTLLFLMLFAPALSFGQPPTSASPNQILDIAGTDRPETILVAMNRIGGARGLWVINVDIVDDLGRHSTRVIYPLEYWNKTVIRIEAGDGDDIIEVDLDMDCWIYGGKGHDEIYSGSGDDLIHGGDGDDILYGGPGSDYLIGGKSFIFGDWLDGEEGLDKFTFGFWDTVEDHLYDDDTIDLLGSYAMWFAPLPPADSYNKVTGEYTISEY